MKSTSRILLGLIIAFTATAAFALIRIDLTLPTIQEKSTRIFAAKISKIDPSRKLVEASITDILKGDGASGARVLVQIVQPESLLQQLKPNDPLVVMVGEKTVMIHLADTWLGAEALRGKDVYRVNREEDNARKAFPGRTIALIAALKEPKSTLLNAAEDNILQGPIKDLGQTTLQKPTSVLAADLDSDGKPELIICAAGTLHILKLVENATKDITDSLGLSNIKASKAAAGDFGDGKVSLIASSAIYTNSGGKFTRAASLQLPPDDQLLAITIQNHALYTLTPSGQLSIHRRLPSGELTQTSTQLWPATDPAPLAAAIAQFGDTPDPAILAIHKDSITRYSTASSIPPADFSRLTGEKSFKPLSDIIPCPLDINGDSRSDLLLVGPESGLLLVNRGFGAFLASEQAPKVVNGTGQRKTPFHLTPTTLLFPADLESDKFDDLLILTPDGHLYAMLNPPHGVKP